MSETPYNPRDHLDEVIDSCRDDDKTDFTAMVNMMQKLNHTYGMSKDEAIEIARKEGNWSDRDVENAAHLVYDYGM